MLEAVRRCELPRASPPSPFAQQGERAGVRGYVRPLQTRDIPHARELALT